jgi:hypothetical protein
MRNIFQSLVDFAGARTQQEWNEFFRGQVYGLRAFVRENGEVAALVGFGVGIALALFFKLFLFLFCLLALSYLVLIIMAKD